MSIDQKKKKKRKTNFFRKELYFSHWGDRPIDNVKNTITKTIKMNIEREEKQEYVLKERISCNDLMENQPKQFRIDIDR